MVPVPWPGVGVQLKTIQPNLLSYAALRLRLPAERENMPVPELPKDIIQEDDSDDDADESPFHFAHDEDDDNADRDTVDA